MLTNNDITRAIKISQAIQDYFDEQNIQGELRSTDVYDVLVKKNLVEKDRHQGIKFRAFLKKLKKNNELHFIPQCRAEENGGYSTNWFFRSAPGKTIKTRNLKPIAEAGKVILLDLEKVKNEINELPKRDTGNFTHVELGTREKYPRAYEFWTAKEEEILLEVVKEITDSFKLSVLFQRQPSSIRNRLKNNFNIIL